MRFWKEILPQQEFEGPCASLLLLVLLQKSGLTACGVDKAGDKMLKEIPAGVTSTTVAELERLRRLLHEGGSIEEDLTFRTTMLESDTQVSCESTVKNESYETCDLSSRDEEWTVMADIVERPSVRCRHMSRGAGAVRQLTEHDSDHINETDTPEDARRPNLSPGSSQRADIAASDYSRVYRRHVMSDIEWLAFEGRSSWQARLLGQFSVRRLDHRQSDSTIEALTTASCFSQVCAFTQKRHDMSSESLNLLHAAVRAFQWPAITVHLA